MSPRRRPRPATPAAAVLPRMPALAAVILAAAILSAVILSGAILSGPGARAAETVAPPVLPDPGTWLPRQAAELRVLDKVSAQAIPLVLAVGQGAGFHSLSVTVRACAVRPPELPPDSAAFLDIVDSHEGQPGFHGWMFSGEPQVAMLENPLYDVHLLSCRADAPAPAATTATTAPPAAAAPGRAPR